MYSVCMCNILPDNHHAISFMLEGYFSDMPILNMFNSHRLKDLEGMDILMNLQLG